MPQRTAACPVDSCDFNDTPSQVAAHIDGTSDPDHDWSELPYEGPDAFLHTARSDDAGVSEGGVDATSEMGAASVDEDSPPNDADSESTTQTGEQSELSETADDSSAGDESGSSAPGDESTPTPPSDESAPAIPNENSASVTPDDSALTVRDDYAGLLPDDDLVRGARATFGLLEELKADSVEELPLDELVNLFTVFSILSSAAGNARSDIREEIIERIDGNVDLSAEFGTVSHTIKTSRSLRDDETVRRRLQDAGVDPADAEALDEDLVAGIVDETGLDEESVFELDDRESVRRAEVNEDALDEFDGDR